MDRSTVRSPFVAASCIPLCIFFLTACAETPRETPPPATLRVATSSTTEVLLDDLSDQYRFEHPWITFEIEAFNTAGAIEQLNNGAVDLAIVSWLPGDFDSRAWRSPLAYDAVAVIVHPANPLDSLSLAELREVFQGHLLDWSPLGWEGQELIVVSREEGSGTRAAFEEAVMDGRAVTRNAVVRSGGAAVIDYVARTPGAIGYVSRGRVAAGVKPIAIDGIAPDALNAANGSYPIGRAVYVVARSEPDGAAHDFVAWLFGEQGQAMITERGFGRVK